MISDIPDGFFLIPDLIVATTDKVNFNLTQEDIDDMSVDTSFPLRNPRYGPVIDISEDDLPY